LCAAGGNIVTQMVMQKSMDQPLMVQNAMLYSWVCSLSLSLISHTHIYIYITHCACVFLLCTSLKLLTYISFSCSLYIYKGVLLNGFNWWVFTTSYEQPWFGDFTPKVLFLCCFSAVYGLSISVILKRFGSLTRTFISTIAVVLNAMLDTWFFSVELSVG